MSGSVPRCFLAFAYRSNILRHIVYKLSVTLSVGQKQNKKMDQALVYIRQLLSLSVIVISVWSLGLGPVGWGRRWNWASWELGWCFWRSETPSPGTMCCTYGHSPSMTYGASVPKNSTESSVLAPLTTSVSLRSVLSVWSPEWDQMPPFSVCRYPSAAAGSA